MSDLIRREEAIEWVKNILATHLYYHPRSKSRNVPIDEVIDRLERVPSIDAVQRTDDVLQRMQDIEQAQIQKAYDLGYEEGKADAESQWIPCSEVTGEGYPKEDGFYYVTERNYGFYLETDVKQNIAHTSPFFNGDFTDRFYDENHSNIVAWMPLPKPYERKES